jgi:hypothetical protein
MAGRGKEKGTERCDTSPFGVLYSIIRVESIASEGGNGGGNHPAGLIEISGCRGCQGVITFHCGGGYGWTSSPPCSLWNEDRCRAQSEAITRSWEKRQARKVQTGTGLRFYGNTCLNFLRGSIDYLLSMPSRYPGSIHGLTVKQFLFISPCQDGIESRCVDTREEKVDSRVLRVLLLPRLVRVQGEVGPPSEDGKRIVM